MLAHVRNSYGILARNHYLGPIKSASFAWIDEHGAMVFGNPNSRKLPQDWFELVRWCIIGQKNSGSKQWSAFAKWAKVNLSATTVISYSDPSKGHTGALYRACNWLWAPTWHRLRPPPSGNGAWSTDARQAVKDRWVYPLKEDVRRQSVLQITDKSVLRVHPRASYVEPAWKRGKFDAATGGGEFSVLMELEP